MSSQFFVAFLCLTKIEPLSHFVKHKNTRENRLDSEPYNRLGLNF